MRASATVADSRRLAKLPRCGRAVVYETIVVSDHVAFRRQIPYSPDIPRRRRRNQREHPCEVSVGHVVNFSQYGPSGDGPGRVDRRPRPRARQATLVAYKYVGLSRGVLLADDAALTEIDEALQVAERSSEDIAVVRVRLALGTALIYHVGGDRQRGFKVLPNSATCALRSVTR
jgi:hypothetical protein